jgi:hypothetical protein
LEGGKKSFLADIVSLIRLTENGSRKLVDISVVLANQDLSKALRLALSILDHLIEIGE